MAHAIIFDCEFLTVPGAMNRRWCGPLDPDPSVTQIGAVKLSLEPEFSVLETFSTLILTSDRFGAKTEVDPFFTELTGITQHQIDENGVGLAEALDRFDRFADGGSFWSWGKDELTLLAISCYVEGLTPPIPADRFGNACGLLMKAGMPYADVQTTTSGGLADYFGIKSTERRHHDALDDAMSVAITLQHFLGNGRLRPADFSLPLAVTNPAV